MAFEWKEYLDLARVLHGETNVEVTKEAGARCGVSRAYYAAFCYARNYARDYLGFVPWGKPEDHGRLLKYLRRRKRGSTVNLLKQLREWRNACDYDDDVSFELELTLAAAINQAQKAIESLT